MRFRSSFHLIEIAKRRRKKCLYKINDGRHLGIYGFWQQAMHIKCEDIQQSRMPIIKFGEIRLPSNYFKHSLSAQIFKLNKINYLHISGIVIAENKGWMYSENRQFAWNPFGSIYRRRIFVNQRANSENSEAITFPFIAIVMKMLILRKWFGSTECIRKHTCIFIANWEWFRCAFCFVGKFSSLYAVQMRTY